ncbi:MAG TPA: HD domain-containing phosphohydrolase [bacterium]|nr:HD domain-containing phosphohydrolase [bacterium]
MSSVPPPPANRPTDHVLWRGDAEGGKRPSTDKPGEILRLLSRAWRNAALYGGDHRVAQGTINDLHQFLTEALSSRSSFRLFIQEDTFFEEERVLLEESLRLYSLLTAFTERQMRSMQFNVGVDTRELKILIEVLNTEVEDLEHRGGAEAYLKACAVQHIAVGSTIIAGSVIGGRPEEKAGSGKGGPGTGGGEGGEGGGSPPPRLVQAAPVKVDPQDAYRAGLRVVDELSYQASMNLPLNLAKAQMVVNYFLDIIGDERLALLGIAALKNYDEDTYHHSVNVCILSLLLASQLNMDRTLLVLVGLAGLLHDVGKVRVPRDIITKPAKLTPEEMEIVKRHSIHGAHILREVPGLSRLAMVVAFEHHANYDLSGYPRITVKKAPHLITNIVWLADCFDAMTTARRAYRAAKRPDEALKEILDGAGTTFDPLLAKLFCKYCGTFFTRSTPGEDKPRPETPGSGGGAPD